MSIDGQDFVQYGHESGVSVFIPRFGTMPPMTREIHFAGQYFWAILPSMGDLHYHNSPSPELLDKGSKLPLVVLSQWGEVIIVWIDIS